MRKTNERFRSNCNSRIRFKPWLGSCEYLNFFSSMHVSMITIFIGNKYHFNQPIVLRWNIKPEVYALAGLLFFCFSLLSSASALYTAETQNASVDWEKKNIPFLIEFYLMFFFFIHFYGMPFYLSATVRGTESERHGKNKALSFNKNKRPNGC